LQQSPFTEMPFKHWCEGGDLNPYALRRRPRSYHPEKTSADTPYLESSSRCPPVRIPQAPLSDGIPVDTRHGLLLRLMCPSQTASGHRMVLSCHDSEPCTQAICRGLAVAKLAAPHKLGNAQGSGEQPFRTRGVPSALVHLPSRRPSGCCVSGRILPVLRSRNQCSGLHRRPYCERY
jgi:hypothetical protein